MYTLENFISDLFVLITFLGSFFLIPYLVLLHYDLADLWIANIKRRFKDFCKVVPLMIFPLFIVLCQIKLDSHNPLPYLGMIIFYLIVIVHEWNNWEYTKDL
jgi:hypothetical protein